MFFQNSLPRSVIFVFSISIVLFSYYKSSKMRMMRAYSLGICVLFTIYVHAYKGWDATDMTLLIYDRVIGVKLGFARDFLR